MEKNISKTLLLFIISFVSIVALAQAPAIKIESKEVESWWLENKKSPLFHMTLYLGDGSFSDEKNFSGMSASSLSLAFKGTSNYNESQISEFFDRYGASISSDVKHEFSSISLSGLVDDIKPLIKMVCHIANDAQFPQKKIDSYKKRLIAQMDNLATSPSDIASMVFRSESLKASTQLEIPSEGLKKDLQQITKNNLQTKLNYLSNKVFRRLYISGPKSSKKIPVIMAKECGWGENPSFVRVKVQKPISRGDEKSKIVFVPLENSNQAQIILGDLLTGPVEKDKQISLSVMQNYLAGAGFVSELFAELRVKRGLTYGVQAYASMQKLYGRSLIMTSTKNQKVYEMLKTIQSILRKLALGHFDKQRLDLVTKNLKGSYLFAFEQDMNFLQSLMHTHHLGFKQNDIYEFPNKVGGVSQKDLINAIKNAFDWNHTVIVVAGDKKLLPVLKRFKKKVKTVNWKDYL